MKKVFLFLKEFGKIRRNYIVMKIIAGVILFSIITSGIAFAEYSNKVNEGLKDNLIRLHVIANSDSVDDQTMKRAVRDKILEYMKSKLKASNDIETTKRIINSNREQIEKLSKEVITQYGKDYSIKTVLGNFPFPTKSYGDVTLPSGNYQALRVIIGKGEGANWWCVLFPPLCFVDASHGTVPESVKQKLKNTLSDDEYGIITTTDNEEDIPVKIKFKIVEVFQDSKMKFTGLLSKLF